MWWQMGHLLFGPIWITLWVSIVLDCLSPSRMSYLLRHSITFLSGVVAPHQDAPRKSSQPLLPATICSLSLPANAHAMWIEKGGDRWIPPSPLFLQITLPLPHNTSHTFTPSPSLQVGNKELNMYSSKFIGKKEFKEVNLKIYLNF